MFFVSVQEPMEIYYHGLKYVVSANANNNHRQCRDLLIREIFDKITVDELTSQWTPEDYLAKKKELVTKLKEWDKKYIAHAKTVNPELNTIHTAAMAPLVAFMKSNKDFHNFNVLLQAEKSKGDVPLGERLPEFLFEALEKEFVKDFMEICRIISNYPHKKLLSDEGEKLMDPYDIKQMLDTLKVENWEKIKPFEFYFRPLKEALEKTVAIVI